MGENNKCLEKRNVMRTNKDVNGLIRQLTLQRV